ncbi:Meiotically up-regulated protein [Rutstroemia sp. NJR-2017a BBW]|nr:Meiotically up-regulated protein [Rutstroemia sp. NJR-2017a BBW]
MPRLVRRKPALERITDWLNPQDWVLWLSEEIETRDWDSNKYAHPIAFGLHFVLLIARANSGNGGNGDVDDVFGDVNSGSGWLIHSGGLYSNNLLGLERDAYFHPKATLPTLRKLYRRTTAHPLCEKSSCRFIAGIILSSSILLGRLGRYKCRIAGSSRSNARCVGNISLGPGTNQPTTILFIQSRACTGILVILAHTDVLMTGQLLLLQTSFAQQEKDTSIIQKEVMSEYDIKFVHPRMNPVMRDVGTQFSGPSSESRDGREEEVEIYTPSVVLKKGFRTNPNPNYAKHVDPENTSTMPRQIFSPAPSFISTAFNPREPSPYKKISTAPMRQPQFRKNTPSGVEPVMEAVLAYIAMLILRSRKQRVCSIYKGGIVGIRRRTPLIWLEEKYKNNWNGKETEVQVPRRDKAEVMVAFDHWADCLFQVQKTTEEVVIQLLSLQDRDQGMLRVLTGGVLLGGKFIVSLLIR